MRGLNLGLGMKKGTVASAPGSSYLDSISGLNVEFELDATVSDSYGGSGQTWSNLTSSPNSGASQTDYDLYLGATSGAEASDPTFTGSAGDSAAYWLFDGGDYFSHKAAETAFIKNMHKTTGGGPRSFVFAFRTDAAMGGNQYFFSNALSTVNDDGLSFRLSGVNDLRLQQFDNVGARTTTSSSTLTASTIYLVGVTFDYTTSDAVQFFIGSTTPETTAIVKGTTTADPTDATLWGARSDGSNQFKNGFRLYSVAAMNKVIDGTDFGNIASNWGTRHSRSYV